MLFCGNFLLRIVDFWSLIKRRLSETGTRKMAAKILIAEDDEDNRFLFGHYFEKSGHSVKMVENGVLAVRECKTTAYDIVFLDIQMPVMDGEQALAEILELMQSGVHPEVPVVALTAYALDENRRHFLSLGFHRILAKPVKKVHFLELVDELLS